MKEMYGVKSIDWLGCPHCGDQPEIETIGTWIEIYCCASMSFQKCDYLTIEERQEWSNDSASYSVEAEQKVLIVASKQWNTRKQG